MKTKVFSLLAVVLFAGSLMSNASSIANLEDDPENEMDCVNGAMEIQRRWEKSGWSKVTSNHLANLYYEACMESLN